MKPWDERLQAIFYARMVLPPAVAERADMQIKLKIMDAYRDGVRGADEIAFSALQRQGLKPRWVEQGGVRTMVTV